MELNKTSIPNVDEMNWQMTRTTPMHFDPLKTTFNGFFSPNLGWNSQLRLDIEKEIQLLEVNLIPTGIEIISRKIDKVCTPITPLDVIVKDIYTIKDGVLVYSKSLYGRYVSPKPATYEFDE